MEIHSASFPRNLPWGRGNCALIIQGSSNQGKEEASIEVLIQPLALNKTLMTLWGCYKTPSQSVVHTQISPNLETGSGSHGRGSLEDILTGVEPGHTSHRNEPFFSPGPVGLQGVDWGPLKQDGQGHVKRRAHAEVIGGMCILSLAPSSHSLPVVHWLTLKCQYCHIQEKGEWIVWQSSWHYGSRPIPWNALGTGYKLYLWNWLAKSYLERNYDSW